jgi:hypothetical protein
MAEIYSKSYFSQIKRIKLINNEKFLIVPSLTLIDYTSEIVNTSSKDVADTVSNIVKITEHINNSDEIVDYNKCYESFIIAKLIRMSEFNEYSGKSKVVLNIFDNTETRTPILIVRKERDGTQDLLLN